jgi:predicted deacylase/predicted double-glycine peptidase
MLNITPFRQKPGYCGPASLKMVLDFWGVKITEKKIVEISGCSKTRGIKAEGLVRAARILGFHAKIKDFSDLKDIHKWVNKKKVPVIVDWFAFEGGHYSVVSGIDKENIYLEDPSLGYRRALKLTTFKRLWFDFPNDYLKSKSELIVRRMIVIEKSTRYDRFLEISCYNAELKKLAAARRDIEIKRHRLKHRASGYDFFRIASSGIKQNDRIMLIRAGIHGDEVAGPLTIIQYLNRIFDYAHKRDVKLIIYPLGNPAGFDARQRYNTDYSDGLGANNDFVLYELVNGNLTGDIGRAGKFKRWYWSSDHRLNHGLPAETAMMHKLLKRDPLECIVASLDLHQDYISPCNRAAAYHYAFGDLSVYGKIVDTVNKSVPVIANKIISAGQPSGMRTNKEGFIIRHDGTLGDLLYRLGVKYSVAPETTGKTPLDKACLVNWLWIKGLIDLSAKKRATVKRAYFEEVASPLKINIPGHRIIKTGRVRTDSGVHPIYAVVTQNYRKDLPRVILSAGIHGEEPAGVYTLLEFMNRGIVKYLDHFSFLILPCLNPYGFTRGVRFSCDVSDLNRSFDDVPGPPEVAAVKELLRRFPGPYRLGFDFHETDTHMPKGEHLSVENIPAGAYMYETTRTGQPSLGPLIINGVRNSGYPITQRRSVYGAACQNGLIYTTAPDKPDYPTLPEFNGTLDWYFLKNGHTDHFLATETPTAWPLKRRIAFHKKALIQALNHIKKENCINSR